MYVIINNCSNSLSEVNFLTVFLSLTLMKHAKWPENKLVTSYIIRSIVLKEQKIKVLFNIVFQDYP